MQSFKFGNKGAYLCTRLRYDRGRLSNPQLQRMEAAPTISHENPLHLAPPESPMSKFEKAYDYDGCSRDTSGVRPRSIYHSVHRDAFDASFASISFRVGTAAGAHGQLSNEWRRAVSADA